MTKPVNKRLANDRILYRIRRAILKTKYGKKVAFGSNLRMHGSLPILKLPKEGKLVLGDNVILNSDTVNSNTSLTTRVKFVSGINGKITVGDNCDFNGTCIVAYDEIQIGDCCQFASSTLISDTDFHPVDPAERQNQMQGNPYSFEKVSKKKIEIGNNVWVGWGAIILKGVTIGDNSIIAAGAVVISDVPANSIAAGNPASVVKNI